MKKFLFSALILIQSLAYTQEVDKPSIDFEAINVNGSKINLSDFKGKVVLLDFWASWCGPCKMFAPIFNDVSKKYPLKATFAKVNTENEQALASKYHIASIPTLVIFKNGKEVKRVSGALDPLRLSNLVNEFV